MRELEDDQLSLDPACAVACSKLLSDLDGIPFLNPTLPHTEPELRSRVRRIRSGFSGLDRDHPADGVRACAPARSNRHVALTRGG